MYPSLASCPQNLLPDKLYARLCGLSGAAKLGRHVRLVDGALDFSHWVFALPHAILSTLSKSLSILKTKLLSWAITGTKLCIGLYQCLIINEANASGVPTTFRPYRISSRGPTVPDIIGTHMCDEGHPSRTRPGTVGPWPGQYPQRAHSVLGQGLLDFGQARTCSGPSRWRSDSPRWARSICRRQSYRICGICGLGGTPLANVLAKSPLSIFVLAVSSITSCRRISLYMAALRVGTSLGPNSFPLPTKSLCLLRT